MKATARQVKSESNHAYVRALLEDRQPALAALLQAVADAFAREPCRTCPRPRGCGVHHGGECTSEWPHAAGGDR